MLKALAMAFVDWFSFQYIRYKTARFVRLSCGNLQRNALCTYLFAHVRPQNLVAGRIVLKYFRHHSHRLRTIGRSGPP